MAVHPSSANFGKNMGIGWREGLQYKYANRIGMTLEWKVYRKNGEEAGDIDAIIDSDTALAVSDLFPSVSLSIRPRQSERPKKGCIYLAEIKRSLSDSNTQGKIEQFVHFYYDLLCNDGLSSVKTKRIPSNHRKVIFDSNATLLFVFNGEDQVKVEKTMRQEIQKATGKSEMKIAGRDVVCVWCDSAELIKWKELQLSKNNYKIIKEKDKIIEEKDKEIEEKDKEIEDLRKRLRIFENSSRQINKKRRVI
jgi:hypothetical protein